MKNNVRKRNKNNVRKRNLVAALHKEPTLLQERISEESIKKAFSEKRAAAKLDSTAKNYIAFAMLWRTKDPSWYELGTIWVSPKHQRKGLMPIVFEKCAKKLPKGCGVFLITHNIKVLEVARSFGWQLARSNWHDSEFWTRIAEPWDKWGPGQHSNGALLFFMP